MGKNVKILFVLSLVVSILSGCSNLAKKYEHIKTPQIREMSAQKVLVVKSEGVPNETSTKAIGKLFKVFFMLKKEAKDLQASSLKARWPISVDKPQEEWVGLFEETENINKIMKYIDDNGYKIAGPHEEEYIKGPGMFFKGNPEKYLTIIRYPVK